MNRLLRFLHSLRGRLALSVMALGLLLGTLLFVGVLYVVTADYQAQFVNQVRSQSYLLVNMLGQNANRATLEERLNDVLLSGQILDARYVSAMETAQKPDESNRQPTPPAHYPALPAHYQEDFFFGEHGDGVYYLALPIDLVDEHGTLILGFDESYTAERIQDVTHRGLYLALAFSALLLILVVVLGTQIGRPLRRLQAAAHRIASGQLEQRLLVPAHIEEIADLATDLDHMRNQLLRHGAEIAVREARHRAVLENAAEGIMTLDRLGRIESFNTAAENIFGYDSSEVLGTTFTRFLDSADVNRCITPDGEPRTLTGLAVCIRRKNGETLHVLLSISAFTHETDRLFTVVAQDISERIMFEEKLTHLAYYDPLTGLPNRRLFHDRLGQALSRAERHEKLVAVLFLDLDRFKNINDTLGHLFGDLLIQAAAKRLLEVVRKDDTVARLGGDEFTLVLTDIANVDDAAQVARKILAMFARPFQLGEHEVFITTSIGITIYPFDDSDIENLIKNADTAMYQAKSGGRNAYEFFGMHMHAGASERLALETALRKAVHAGELEVCYQPQVRVHYQPQVDRFTGQIVGAEALLRWQHPELGLIYPDRFISLAEDTGLIIPIGEWILRAACEQQKAWRAAGLPSMRVSVNLSARQLQHPDIVAQITRVLEETGIDPAHLELELTERMILHDIDEVAARLREFKAMGMMISIDDFGTGHSSLSNIQMLPIDEIKIDRSFVHDITRNAQSAAIAGAVIDMAHKLGLRVVAEGVELEEQLIYLHDRKCDLLQGYYFSRPLPATDFEALLATEVVVTTPLLSGRTMP
ncbi:MAG: EAL domain-containing protein [Gammaproteobacteria bacterium]|nr:EAL domain-containing protein [Gammaproteobacteria bacterium]